MKTKAVSILPALVFAWIGFTDVPVAHGRESRRATSAPAERRTSEGRRHYQAAERLFEDGRFAEAMAEYEDGYRLTRLPGFLVNMARCRIRLGQLSEARTLYQRYLEEAPASPRRAEVASALATLEQRIADDRAAAAPRSPFADATPPPPPPSARDRERRLALPTSLSSPPIAPLFTERTSAPHAADRAPWIGPVMGGLVLSAIAGAAVIWLGGMKNHDAERGSLGTLTR